MRQSEAVVESKRFGEYLRKIREERRLSLDAVEEMSLGFRERVTKSHLSRIENGQAIPTFPRMFTLSQIYGVPVTSIAERFEIELWRDLVPVDAAAWSDEKILEEAGKLKLSGSYVELLSLVATALERSRKDVESGITRGNLPKLHLYLIDCLVHLGRFESAKAECELLLGSRDLPQDLRVLALLAFITCCYRLKRFTIAQMGLNEAGAELRSMGDAPKLEADLEFQRAAVSWALGELEKAAAGYERASSLYQLVPERFEACKARVNLGQVLIELENKAKALSMLRAALKVAEEAGYDRLQALALSHLGALAFQEHDFVGAETYLLRSNSIARTREYLSLVFRNCYYLWKIAGERGDQTAVKANERTLRTYLGRVDPDLTEVVAFRTSLTGGPR